MSPLALLLVLSAAVCHAAWNYFVKRVNGGAELVWLFSLISAVVYLPLAAFIWITFEPSFGCTQWAFVFGSIILHLGYFLLLQKGYRYGDLSLVYPTARSTGPMLSGAMAILFLGETLSGPAAAGGCLIVVGLWFLTGGGDRRAQHVFASLAFGVGAGTLIGAYTVWDAYAVTALAIPPILLDYASSVGRVVLLAPAANRKRCEIRQHLSRHRGAVIAIALLNPLAYILVLYALTFTPVVYVAPTREMSVLLSVILGSILLREGQLGRRLGWAAVIVLGVALLVTG